jgi:hypothetical protein
LAGHLARNLFNNVAISPIHRLPLSQAYSYPSPPSIAPSMEFYGEAACLVAGDRLRSTRPPPGLSTSDSESVAVLLAGAQDQHDQQDHTGR